MLQDTERHALELLALLEASTPQLRSLQIKFPDEGRMRATNIATAWPAALRRLSQLTSFTLEYGGAHEAQINAIVQTLPSLQRLSISGSSGFPSQGFPGSSELRCLEISGARHRTVSAELGRLTGLTRLKMASSQMSSLPDAISRPSRLRELDVSQNESLALPPSLTACQKLTSLGIESDLSPVLAQSLQHLRVESLGSQQPHWCQLTALTELELLADSDNPYFPSKNLPAGLGGMNSILKLRIECAKLAGMPEGPCLSCLESLVLYDCLFPNGLPAVLASAKQLRHLRVCDDEVAYRYRDSDGYPIDLEALVKLTAADVALISGLPGLTRLGLTMPGGLSRHMWDERLAHLQAAFVAQGRAPPAVFMLYR